MRALSSNVGRPIPIGASLKVTDNSGAKIIKVVGVRKFRGSKKRLSKAGIGDIIVGAVQKGKPGMKKQVLLATIVRQKKEFKRANGLRVKFEDNAAVIVSDVAGVPTGTRIKGAVAKEAIDRFPTIGKISSVVV